MYVWSSVTGEGQSCEEGEAVGDKPRLQDPLHGAQVRPGPTSDPPGGAQG